MDVGIVCKKPLFVGVEEIGAVVDRGLFAWGSTKDFGAPSIPASKGQRPIFCEMEGKEQRILQMAVEVDDTNGSICPVHTSQKWESNCVISAERDDPWQCFPRF